MRCLPLLVQMKLGLGKGVEISQSLGGITPKMAH